jgi:hypothetical protein
MASHQFDLVSPDMAGTTVDEGGLVYEVLVRARIRLHHDHQHML